MENLLELDRKRKFPVPPVPTELLSNPFPLQAEAWRLSLLEHPDSRLREYVVNGIREGFRIGFDYSTHSCKRARKNMSSALNHPEVVNKYIAEECGWEAPWPLRPGFSTFGSHKQFQSNPKEHTGKVAADIGPVISRRLQCQ